MKRYITPGIINSELTREQSDKLYEWWNQTRESWELYLTIGRLIEFLNEKQKPAYLPVKKATNDTLCTELWEDVKEVLQNE
jgi:hypothetical protein